MGTVKMKEYLLKEEQSKKGIDILNGATYQDKKPRKDKERILKEYKELFGADCVLGGNDDYRNIASLTQFAKYLVTADIRQHNVRNNEVVPSRECCLLTADALKSRFRLIPRRKERFGEKRVDVGAVLNDQYFAHYAVTCLFYVYKQNKRRESAGPT